MKKILFWIFSAVLAVAGTMPASAQKAQRDGGLESTVALKAAPAQANDARALRMPQARTTGINSLLRTPATHAVARSNSNGSVHFRSAGQDVTVNGALLYSMQEGAKKSLVSFKANATDLQTVFNMTFNTLYTGVMVDDVYYFSDYQNLFGIIQYFTIQGYDINTGEKVFNSSSDIANLFYGLCVDPTSGEVYGIGYNTAGNGYELSKVSFSGEGTVTRQIIADVSSVSPAGFNGMAITSDGQLYVMTTELSGEDVTGGKLLKMDKTSGAVTEMSELPGAPVYIAGACADPNTNKLYFNLNNDEEAAMYEVNTTSGAFTKLGDFPFAEEIAGLYIAKLAEAGTPNPVTNLAANFEGGSLSGNITFTAPATTTDGASTGSLTYKVLCNGDQVATGTCAFGANVTAPVTVAEPGSYVFSVVVYNGELFSKTVKVTVFVGNGMPAAPANVQAVFENGTITVTWDAVTSSADGGYLNPAEVTYAVYSSKNDNVSVLTNSTTATSITENVGNPTSLTTYRYVVMASFADMRGAGGESNTIVLGQLEPPYTNDFNSADRLDEMTIIDANGDGKKWMYNDGAARVAYNSSLAMDDWMMTPPLKLVAGKAYIFSFKAKNHSASYTERIEVKMGNEATVEAMTKTLLEPTELTGTAYHEFEKVIVPETTGNYVIGFHGISDKDKFYLYVDDIEVSAGISAAAPNVPTDLVVTPAAGGALNATVSFKAPAVDFAGNALTSNLTEIIVKRGDLIVKTFNNVAPGAECSFVDNMNEGGDVTYSVQAINADGEGLVATATAFIGINLPGTVQNVVMTEEGNTGTVTVTWDPVTTDVNGLPLAASDVTYAVYLYSSNSRTLIQEGLTTTSLTFQAAAEGEQDLVQYAVWAYTEAGEGEGNLSNMDFVGTPYADFVESVENGQINHDIMIYRYAGSPQWSLCNDATIGGVTAADGDNGYFAMKGSNENDKAALDFGKITTVGLTNPAVTLYTYNIIGSEGDADVNLVDVMIREVGTDEYVTISSKTVAEICEGMEDGWGKYTVSLAAYEGKVIQLRIACTVKIFQYTMIDNIRVQSMVAEDLAAKAIDAPARVLAGDSYTVNVTVANEGFNAAAAYSVDLYADGEKVATENGENLASGQSAVVAFNLEMPVLAEEPITYSATVVYAADLNNDNNSVGDFVVTPRLSTLPKVDDLAGEYVAEGVKLTWTEPNLEGGVAESKTEDFESAEAGFSSESTVEGWTFIDGDKSPVGGFQGSDIPGMTPGTSTGSFFVFSTSYFPGNPTFEAHSGTQYIAAIFRYDGGTNDDWAISPALSGNAQTISFWVKSYSTDYPEKISVLYSTTSDDVTAFTNETTCKNYVPGGDWTEVAVELPAGATYFAIRSFATDSFMLMLDDVTYEAGSSTANLSILGYDVYRNGEKITAEPTGEVEYIDTNAPEGENAYRVVAVYDRGLSAGSNTVTVQVSGITDTVAGVAVVAGAGQITVTGAEGKAIVINDVAGRTIYSAEGTANTTVAVAPGVYVVKADTTVVKVVVR